MSAGTLKAFQWLVVHVTVDYFGVVVFGDAWTGVVCSFFFVLYYLHPDCLRSREEYYSRFMLVLTELQLRTCTVALLPS